MAIVSVGSIAEAGDRLQQPVPDHASTPIEQLAVVHINLLAIDLRSKGVRKSSITQLNPFCKRVIFTNYRQEVAVDLHYGKRGLTPTVQGSGSALGQVVQESWMPFLAFARRLHHLSHRRRQFGVPNIRFEI